MNRDLGALVFELQRSRSPADKARALARAWRTIRALSPTERRMLVREVGFDGAEDLIEGLSERSGGSFSPAAVLGALAAMRGDEGLSVRRIVSDMRDPDRRQDLVAQAIDVAAASLDPITIDDDEEEPAEAGPTAGTVDLADGTDHDADDEVVREAEVEIEPDGGFELPPVPVPQPDLAPDPEADLGKPAPGRPEPEPEHRVEAEEPSPWDSLREPPDPADTVMVEPRYGLVGPTPDDPGQVGRSKGPGSVSHRLRAIRAAIPALRQAPTSAVIDALANLPEPWARRRAMVALIEAGVPADPTDVLDLIDTLDRPVDRRWCLLTLGRRGDLDHDDLERALDMLTSQAARRRLMLLAGG